ncbi:hypothetical protein ACVOPT_004388 [Enterobacter hormaechei]
MRNALPNGLNRRSLNVNWRGNVGFAYRQVDHGGGVQLLLTLYLGSRLSDVHDVERSSFLVCRAIFTKYLWEIAEPASL